MISLSPIPAQLLEETKVIWFPHLVNLAERYKLKIDTMCERMHSGEIGTFLVWDDEAKKAKAFIGVSYMERAKNERVGEIVWLNGEDRKSWIHLLADLEKYLIEYEQCVSVRTIARKGWKPHLESAGFKLTHMVFEKELRS